MLLYITDVRGLTNEWKSQITRDVIITRTDYNVKLMTRFLTVINHWTAELIVFISVLFCFIILKKVTVNGKTMCV